MKKIITLAIVTGFTMIANAQVTFQKTYGGINSDEGYSVQSTSDGGYIISGRTSSFGAGNVDMYLVKIDSHGNLIWAKTFGGVFNDYAWCAQQTSDGGYIIIGGSYSFSGTTSDVYLVKTDASGNAQWSKTLGTPGNDNEYWGQQTEDNGYIIVGYTGNNGDIYLLKTDSTGNLIWTKTFGGTNVENGFYVQQTSDAGYVIVGSTQSFGQGSFDVYLLKTDSIGNLLWSKALGGTGSDEGYCVQQTSDAGYIITGKSTAFCPDTSEICLIKTDESGNLLWSKTFRGPTAFNFARSVQQSLDGGYVIVGSTQSFSHEYDIYLLKTDTTGNLLWSKTFGGTK